MRTPILALLAVGALSLAACSDDTTTGSVATDPVDGATVDTVDPAVTPADPALTTDPAAAPATTDTETTVIETEPATTQ